MKRKGWLIPILVFVLSFSILFFYQKSQSNVSLATTTELPPILWSKTPTAINKVTYSIGGKQIEVTRQNDKWVLSNLNNKHADDLYIYSILENFTQPIFEEVIEINPASLTQYGIDETCPKLTLYDHDGNEYTLIKGDAIDNLTDYVYAPLSNTVYSMQNTNFTSLKSEETDWLNKQLLDFDLANVTKISFSYKSIQATLTPSLVDNEVTFTSNNINDLLAAEFVHFLQTSKIEQFITDNAPDHVLNVYGFSAPSLKCTIYLNTGTTLSLTIGNINEDENICYATVNESNNIVAIPYFDFSQFDALYAEYHGDSSEYLG
ncbi:MAG: DUF4340 domain-containing protein [Candidatus Cellulosilyticum pullistercoris]|uniref:DUF4340 domain-containing protein n=1 Tax=Candidatus Cellulosilyticum pullistercoris TaxID=2838521 RepID=A0A9E2KAQ7_9FIRM|nr:DUF4340 domain-containing protein [Candidatus Cellulosilyticum pullistercoris]